MKKFFSILLSIIFAVCLFATLLLGVARSNFSYSAITKIASEILKPVSRAPVNDDGLFHPGDVKYTLAQYGGFDLSSVDLSSVDFTNLDVNALVGQYLDAAGVDVEPEFVAEVLASPDFSEFVDKYAGEIVSYVTGATTELSINSDDVKKIMNKSLDMYEKHTGQVVDRSGLDQAIETNVASMKTEITAALDTAKEENAEALAALKIVDFILSMKFFLICIGICAFIALVIFLINMNVFAWLQYVFMPAFIDGLLFFAIALVGLNVLPMALSTGLKEAGLPASLYDGLYSYLSKFLAQVKICGLVTAVVGLALWIVGLVLGKKNKAVQAAA